MTATGESVDSCCYCNGTVQYNYYYGCLSVGPHPPCAASLDRCRCTVTRLTCGVPNGKACAVTMPDTPSRGGGLVGDSEAGLEWDRTSRSRCVVAWIWSCCRLLGCSSGRGVWLPLAIAGPTGRVYPPKKNETTKQHYGRS